MIQEYNFDGFWSKEDLDNTSTNDILMGEHGMGENGMAYEVREVVRAYLGSMDTATLERMLKDVDDEKASDEITLDLFEEINYVLENV